MYAFIHQGTNFTGALDYILDSHGVNNKIVQLLGSEGVDVPTDKDGKPVLDADAMAVSFRIQASMRPQVSKPVQHLILSCPPSDKEKMTPTLWRDVAVEYMRKMHIENTQFIIASHGEKDNPHIHIIYNKVDNDGLTVCDRNFYYRSTRVCREITLEHGLSFGKNLEASKAQTFHRPIDSVKKKAAELVTETLYESTSMEDFKLRLLGKGIMVLEVQRTNRPGLLFNIIGDNGRKYTFSGSQLNRALSFSKVHSSFQKSSENRASHKEDSPRAAEYFRKILQVMSIISAPVQKPVSSGQQRPSKETEKEREERYQAEKTGAIYANFEDTRYEEKLQ